jgi:aminopeptidase YwaD
MKTRSTLFVALLAVVSQSFSQQTQDLLNGRLRDLLRESLSGELAKEHVIQISRHHRIQGSRGYRAAAQYVLDQLRSFGFSDKDATIESFKSDGRVVYQTWQSPSGWDISWGELRMIEPYEERIVGYPEIAMSVMTYSNAGNVKAPLVWVGTGTSDSDYKDKDVAGKIVLATGYGGDVHRLAVLKYGAKAVVCYLDDDRAKDHPDMLQYTGMWPRTDELERVTFGFNLSHRQGEKLRDLILSGKKVVVRGEVKGIGLEPYFMDVVVARMQGTEKAEEEIVLSAHLDHPKESANDNASGSAALLDIARSLKDLTDSGRMPKLKRSVRFVWVPEWNGTMPYIDAHPELVGPQLGGKFLANLNMDMVGENQELLHSMLIMTRTPNSIPSVLIDVMENMAQMTDGLNIRTPRGSQSSFNYRVVPYSGGSDHMMFIDRKIPGVMMVHGPDYTHHTSDDTPDKVDPVELARSEMIAAGTVVFLSNLATNEALDLVYLSGANALQRLGQAGRNAARLVLDTPTDRLPAFMREARITIEENARVGKEGISTILWFNADREIQRAVKKSNEQLSSYAQGLLEEIRIDAATRLGNKDIPVFRETPDKRVPVRLTRGPLDFGLPESKLPKGGPEVGVPRYQLNGDVRFEIPNFIDGKNTLSDIGRALTGEFGGAAVEGFDKFIEDLVKVGVVKWK